MIGPNTHNPWQKMSRGSTASQPCRSARTYPSGSLPWQLSHSLHIRICAATCIRIAAVVDSGSRHCHHHSGERTLPAGGSSLGGWGWVSRGWRRRSRPRFGASDFDGDFDGFDERATSRSLVFGRQVASAAQQRAAVPLSRPMRGPRGRHAQPGTVAHCWGPSPDSPDSPGDPGSRGASRRPGAAGMYSADWGPAGSGRPGDRLARRACRGADRFIAARRLTARQVGVRAPEPSGPRPQQQPQPRSQPAQLLPAEMNEDGPKSWSPSRPGGAAPASDFLLTKEPEDALLEPARSPYPGRPRPAGPWSGLASSMMPRKARSMSCPRLWMSCRSSVSFMPVSGCVAPRYAVPQKQTMGRERGPGRRCRRWRSRSGRCRTDAGVVARRRISRPSVQQRRGVPQAQSAQQ